MQGNPQSFLGRRFRQMALAAPLTSRQRFIVALLLSLGLHAAIVAGLKVLPVRPKMQAVPPLAAVLILPAAIDADDQSDKAAPAASSVGTPAQRAEMAPSDLRQATRLSAPPPAPPKADAAAAKPEAGAHGTQDSAVDYLALRTEIAAFGLDVAERDQATGAGPRTRRLPSAAAESTAEAAYLEMWRQRVQRIGNANYPAGAAYGDLRLQVLIRHDGALLDARVVQSSGIDALDAAALRIVRLAAPFASFSVDMRKSYEQLEITRRWRFSRLGARLAE